MIVAQHEKNTVHSPIVRGRIYMRYYSCFPGANEDEIRKMDDDDSHSRCCGIGPVGGMPLLRHSDVWGAVCKAVSAGVPTAMSEAMPNGVRAGMPGATRTGMRRANLPLPELRARRDGGGTCSGSGVP